MANGSTTTAIVLKVPCGQTLTTTVGGVAVQIECTQPWEPPEPPSGAGGVLGLVEIAAEGSRFDLDAVVRAFRADRLDEEAVPLGPGATATMVWERADGSYVSLDALMTQGEAED